MTSEEVSYLIPYWTQALIKNPNTTLRIDTISDIVHPVQGQSVMPLSRLSTHLDVFLSSFSDKFLWSFFVRNFSEIGRLFIEKKKDAIDTLGS
jgi:hypothetical protein